MHQHSHRPHLLIIEDNPDHQQIIKTALKQCLPGARLAWATNQEQTVTYLNSCCEDSGQSLPQLILLDLHLPEAEDGWQLLKKIKDIFNRRLPVIMFSHSTRSQDVAEAYRLGANSFITKPLSYEEWKDYFKMLRHYWWDINTLPPKGFATTL